MIIDQTQLGRIPRIAPWVDGSSVGRGGLLEAVPGSNLHRKINFLIFPSLAWMSLTKLSLGGNNDVIYKLLPPRESLVSDIPAGDGDIKKLVLRCRQYT